MNLIYFSLDVSPTSAEAQQQLGAASSDFGKSDLDSLMPYEIGRADDDKAAAVTLDFGGKSETWLMTDLSAGALMDTTRKGVRDWV